MTDLQQVLREATEHVASPDLASRALAGAHRRRVRRTAAGALVAVVLLGGAATWVVQDRVPHADVVDTPVPTPTSTPSPSTDDRDPATQAVWDPFTLADAPRRATVLPDELSPPADPPDLAGSSLPDLVVAWPSGGNLRVLGSNGEWRKVEDTATLVDGSMRDRLAPAISPQGDRVAMSTNDGILVVSADGGREIIDWPEGLAGPWDVPPDLIWRPDDEGFVVRHWERPWYVAMDGTGTPVPAGENPYSVMVDPDDGTVRDRTRAYGELRTWNSWDDLSSVSLGGYGERFVTRFGRVAYTGNPGPYGMADRSGPIVVDPGSGEILGYAPIEDPDSVYSDNGHLTALGFLDEDTVLLLVGPMDFRTMELGSGSWHLVAWDFVAGDFEVLSTGDGFMSEIAVAPGLVG
jgi:hypothetical protein